MTEKEKAIQKYMEKLDLSREEAEQLWEDDNSDRILPEQQVLIDKSKAMGRMYEKSTKPRKTSTREKKIDKEKAEIIKYLYDCMQDFNATNSATIENEQKLIAFTTNGGNYSINLVKHRPPKN